MAGSGILPNQYQKLLTHPVQQDLPIGHLISRVIQTIPPIFKLFNINLERYKKSPVLNKALEGRQHVEQIQILQNFFPSFLFVFCSQLKSQAELSSFANELQICGLINLLSRVEFSDVFLKQFLQNLGEDVEIYDQQSQSSKAVSNPSLILNRDLFLIGRSIMWNGRTLTEQLESHYLMRAVTDFFIRYYFELLVLAPDNISPTIYDIFENFLTVLQFQENLYLKRHLQFKQSINKIPILVRNEYTCPNHYLLNKGAFDQIYSVIPMLHKLKSADLVATKRVIDAQLVELWNLSTAKTLLFLRAVRSVYPVQSVEQVVSFIGAKQPQKLKDLLQYMAEPEQLHSCDYLVPAVQKFSQKFLQSLKASSPKARPPSPNRSPNAAALKQAFLKAMNQLKQQSRQINQDARKSLINFASAFQKHSSPNPMNLQQSEEITHLALTGINHLNYTHEADLTSYAEAIKTATAHLEQCNFQQRIERMTCVSNILALSAELDLLRKQAEEEATTYQGAMEQMVALPNGQEGSQIPLKKVLSLPVSHQDKLNLIQKLMGEKLPQHTLNVIQEVYQRCSRDAVRNVQLYKNGKLDMPTLNELLLPQKRENQIAEKELVAIPEIHKPLMAVIDFFELPLGPKEGLSPDKPFEQHFFYLDYLVKRNELSEKDQDEIVAAAVHFSVIAYTKYYDIAPSGRFDELTLLAAYNLWQSNGLKNLRQ